LITAILNTTQKITLKFKLLKYISVKTIMIYTHVLNTGTEVKSNLDG